MKCLIRLSLAFNFSQPALFVKFTRRNPNISRRNLYLYHDPYYAIGSSPLEKFHKMKQKPQNRNDWEIFRSYFKEVKVPARKILLQEGSIARKMYFIEKGCLRTWINNDGKEITTQFFFEGDRVSSIESFRTNQPSLYSIETVEPCILQTITQKDFQTLIEQSPEIKKQFEEHLFKRLFQSQQLFFSYLKNSPEQRYKELITTYPHIVQRVPQHYIASYLGITSVSLSRIRNRK